MVIYQYIRVLRLPWTRPVRLQSNRYKKKSCGEKTEFRALRQMLFPVLSETHFILFRNLRAQLFVLIFFFILSVDVVVVKSCSNFFCGDDCNGISNVLQYTSHSTINTQKKFRFLFDSHCHPVQFHFLGTGSPSAGCWCRTIFRVTFRSRPNTRTTN